jgi:hypothetical protein
MYVNAKTIPVEIVTGIRGGGMIYLIPCKNLCKSYNVPEHNTAIKKKKEMKRKKDITNIRKS